MYAPADPRWSTAILKRADGAVGPYGAGSLIAGAVIDAIDEAAVILRGPDGARTCLALVDGATTRAPKPAPPRDPLVAELEAGILRTGEHSYDVQRSTIESLLSKLDSGPPPARLEPDRRGGETVGFRLREVRPDGPIAQIGLREGDVISSINGLATSVPQNALAIYASLRSVDHLSVAVQRDGRAITAEYDIQ
jgi:general secretion pathway protein C